MLRKHKFKYCESRNVMCLNSRNNLKLNIFRFMNITWISRRRNWFFLWIVWILNSCQRLFFSQKLSKRVIRICAETYSMISLFIEEIIFLTYKWAYHQLINITCVSWIIFWIVWIFNSCQCVSFCMKTEKISKMWIDRYSIK